MNEFKSLRQLQAEQELQQQTIDVVMKRLQPRIEKMVANAITDERERIAEAVREEYQALGEFLGTTRVTVSLQDILKIIYEEG